MKVVMCLSARFLKGTDAERRAVCELVQGEIACEPRKGYGRDDRIIEGGIDEERPSPILGG